MRVAKLQILPIGILTVLVSPSVVFPQNQLTDKGVALSLVLNSTKYSKDDDLNKP